MHVRVYSCVCMCVQELSEPEDLEGGDDEEDFGEDMFGDEDLDLRAR